MTNSTKIALITGAASGLGEAIAGRLAADGCTVVVADIDMDNAERVATELGRSASALKLDVSSEADWVAAIASVESQYGRLDVLVNNAGITTMGSIEDLTFAAFKHEFSIDVDGVFLGSKYGIGLMKKQGGAIINMSSAAGIKAGPYLCAYNGAKGAVNMMTKSIALYCAEQKYNIRCNSVHPGAIHTAIIDKTLAQSDDPDALMANFVASHPVGHLGAPADIAAIVSYLASDEAAFATGAQFVVDGGMTL
ncbi:glucose 1-dehydrogenase [Halieaceae bacterium IMCC14734]|uniref:Glucose 1-dehydrogenase n=1 Tax=Candidatus Litorirhabdus singularis TaxID=2518993 RepID=A0ABT3TG59_9GAMM|nr:glucose 1-dehydrogenase [Candidatus Litorirhabdus singularis]MCX2980810.1 glucose 1-dehydrogenase [Candidatus Litorirhabdus singularis]